MGVVFESAKAAPSGDEREAHATLERTFTNTGDGQKSLLVSLLTKRHATSPQRNNPRGVPNTRYAAKASGCIWWYNHRIQRLATAAITTHIGLPRRRKSAANTTHRFG